MVANWRFHRIFSLILTFLVWVTNNKDNRYFFQGLVARSEIITLFPGSVTSSEIIVTSSQGPVTSTEIIATFSQGLVTNRELIGSFSGPSNKWQNNRCFIQGQLTRSDVVVTFFSNGAHFWPHLSCFHRVAGIYFVCICRIILHNYNYKLPSPFKVN
jgi:hypothetical protein